MSTKRRAAHTPNVRNVEALMDRRYFVLDPERWAAFQVALDAPVRLNPRLKTLLQTPSVFERADARRLKEHAWKLLWRFATACCRFRLPLRSQQLNGDRVSVIDHRKPL